VVLHRLQQAASGGFTRHQRRPSQTAPQQRLARVDAQSRGLLLRTVAAPAPLRQEGPHPAFEEACGVERFRRAGGQREGEEWEKGQEERARHTGSGYHAGRAVSPAAKQAALFCAYNRGEMFLSPLPLPTDLDETSQRRLVLQAARSCAADEIGDLREKQLTLSGLDAEIREHGWLLLFFFWFPFASIPIFLGLLPLWRIRNTIRSRWREMLPAPDPECSLWVAEGDIRRILKALPRSQRKQAREVTRELQRVTRHWAEFQRKLEAARLVLGSASGRSLSDQHAALLARLELESDPPTLASLQRQERALAGQIAAHATLETWRGRLEAAQEECGQSLLHLRSQLALAAATGGTTRPETVLEAASGLQALNDHLGATQAAAEEVLRLGAA